MEIKIGNKTINVKMFCYEKIGDTENLAFKVDEEEYLCCESVIDRISEILADTLEDELYKEYDDENN